MLPTWSHNIVQDSHRKHLPWRMVSWAWSWWWWWPWYPWYRCFRCYCWAWRQPEPRLLPNSFHARIFATVATCPTRVSHSPWQVFERRPWSTRSPRYFRYCYRCRYCNAAISALAKHMNNFMKFPITKLQLTVLALNGLKENTKENTKYYQNVNKRKSCHWWPLRNTV